GLPICWYMMHCNAMIYSITGIIMLTISWRPFISTQRVDKWAPRDGQHDDPGDAVEHHVGIHQKPAGHGFFSQHIIEAHWRVPVGLGTEFGDPGNRKD